MAIGTSQPFSFLEFFHNTLLLSSIDDLEITSTKEHKESKAEELFLFISSLNNENLLRIEKPDI